MSRLRLLLPATVALVLCGSLVSLTWAGQKSGERLGKGARIGGVEVGGLTPRQAIDRVWGRLRADATRSVRVDAGRRTFVLPARRAGLRLRLRAAVDEAHAATQRGSILQRGWRALTGGRVSADIPVRPVVRREAVRDFVTEIEREVARPAVDATLTIAVERVTVTPERVGRRIARPAALEAALVRSLLDPSGDRTLRAAIKRVVPQETRASIWARTPAAVTVSRRDRRARVFRRGELVASYRVAVGQPGSPTPTGRFAVQAKQKDPIWNVPDSEWAGKLAGKTIPAGDPRNPLIARWIGFNGAVGFHGTESVDSLGRAASRGCVRMSRADVISLFRQVDVGTPVLVGR